MPKLTWLALIAFALPAAAETLVVDSDGDDGAYRTIQAAIDAAAPGDRIKVRDGVYAENVVIDVEDLYLYGRCGPVIEGDGTAPAVTVAAEGVRLKGFEIRGGRDGIEARDVRHVKIKRNEVHGNAGIGIALSGVCCRIAGNEVWGNDDPGIVLGRGADPVSTGNDLCDNEVWDNGVAGGSEPGTSGIVLRHAECNDVEDNEATRHDHGAGFFVGANADRNHFEDNDACRNGGTDGFHIDGDENTFRDNDADRNDSDGFDVDGDGNELEHNDADRNDPAGKSGDGYDVRGARNVLACNDAERNTNEGFAVQGDDNEFEDNEAERNGAEGYDFGRLAERNTLIDNEAEENGREGFEISGRGNRLEENEAEDNGGDGFFVDGADNTLEDNEAEDNAGDGFCLGGAGNVLEDNEAEDNGGFGFRDDTTGSGTAGTANTYAGNRCHGNAAGASKPAELCTS